MDNMPNNTTAHADAPGGGPLVLVVEDNEKNARLTLAMLNEGLRLACELKPALVITDLQMPGLDGITMTRELKSMPETTHIPVVAVTAHAMNEHRQQALEAGCLKFLTKPFRFQALLAEVADAIQSAAV
jgi:two-component system cell cycle response regulator DivK